MLSPSRLFFGADDVPADDDGEKPAWSRGVLDLLEDTDAEDEEQTDVPGEHSNEASLNESDEERRSPAVASGAGASGGSQDRPPPPGLQLLGTTPQALGAVGDYAEERPPPFAELPSIGSANHFSGTCDRCCFHPKGRCLNGFNCQHCHYDHEKRKRKSKKKGKVDGFGKDDDEDFLDEAMTAVVEGSAPVSPHSALMAMPRSPLGTLPQASLEGGLPAQRAPLAGPLSAAPDGAAMVGHRAGAAALGEITGSPSPGLEFLGPPLEISSGPCNVGGLGIPPLRPAPPTERPPYAREQLGSGRPEMSPEILAYVNQLEAENRYLKTCLGAGAAGLSTTPHQEQQSPSGSLQMQSMMLQQQMAPQLPQLPAFPSPGGLAQQGHPLAGLSADAVPFWPSTSQATWQEMGTADLDATAGFHAMTPGPAGMSLPGDNPW